MVFSIFGKKSTPSKKAESKPVAGKALEAKPKSSPANLAQQAEISQAAGEDSLDFSTYVPPPKSEPLAEAPSVVPPATLAAVPAERDARPSDLVVSTEVASAAEGVPPIIQETAILFANGQAEQALSILSHSVREADLRASAPQAWLMLLDLYQHLGMRVEFETLALEFVVKFERSPPAWVETAEPNDPALATGGIGYFALSGMLTEASAPELEKLRATTGQSVRLECGKLQGLDGPGCRLLRDALLSLRDAGKEVMLTGETQLTRFLEEACQAGRIETDGAVWALLFEVYRMLDLKDKFEEAAVNYAVTFEVSPPSWELQPGAVAKRPSVVRSTKAAAEAFTLSGEITGANEALAKELQDWAAAHKMLVIDMSGAKRVDLVAAGLMLKVLSELQESGATIQIRGANELISALFGVTGIGKVARIIPRK